MKRNIQRSNEQNNTRTNAALLAITDILMLEVTKELDFAQDTLRIDEILSTTERAREVSVMHHA